MVAKWMGWIIAAGSLMAAAPLRGQLARLPLDSPAEAIQTERRGTPQLPDVAMEPLPLEHAVPDARPWVWQVLPEGLLYRSYLGGVKESRLWTALMHDDDLGWVWDHALGARVGAVRYGTVGNQWPEGWQLDFEGAAYLRQDPEEELDMVATDFRAGIPLTYARGPWHTKLAYYHTSAHLGDEFLLKNPGFVRINYVRDAVVWGMGYYLTPDWRLYGEVAWAFKTDGGAEPWEVQFGADYSPRQCDPFRGAPFFAINAHLREEFDFSGNLSVQAGWQWRQPANGHVMRMGVQYFNGKTPLYEFFDRNEELLGFALWYDF